MKPNTQIRMPIWLNLLLGFPIAWHFTESDTLAGHLSGALAYASAATLIFAHFPTFCRSLRVQTHLIRKATLATRELDQASVRRLPLSYFITFGLIIAACSSAGAVFALINGIPIIAMTAISTGVCSILYVFSRSLDHYREKNLIALMLRSGKLPSPDKIIFLLECFDRSRFIAARNRSEKIHNEAAEVHTEPKFGRLHADLKDKFYKNVRGNKDKAGISLPSESKGGRDESKETL